MADEGKDIQGIDWRRCFAFLEILRSFRMAIHPASLLLCFVGLAASFWLAVIVDQLPAPVGQTEVYGAGFYQHMHRIATVTLWGEWALPYVGGKTWSDFLTFLMSPVNALWQVGDLAITYWYRATWFALINTVISLAIWAFIGAAVARMAAVRVAREESVPLKQALAFSCRKWPSTVTSPLIPFGVLVFLAMIVGAVTGLPLMVPYVGEYVIGVLFCLTLIMGLVMALIFLGGAFSVGLQWPTIAAEGSDAFDAISRSVSYISSRPWKYIFYTVFSVVYGCLTFILVKFVVFLTLMLTHEAVSKFTWGAGDTQDKLMRLWDVPTMANPWPEAGFQQFAGEASASCLFAFWVWVVLGMMMAFLVSFCLCSHTVIYFLLRRSVDATDIEEVYMEESDEDELPLEQAAEAQDEAKAGEKADEAAPPDDADKPETEEKE